MYLLVYFICHSSLCIYVDHKLSDGPKLNENFRIYSSVQKSVKLFFLFLQNWGMCICQLYIQMKAIVFTISIICLTQGAISIDCETGYYADIDFFGDQICKQCQIQCVNCTTSSNCFKWRQEIEGVEVDDSGTSVFYCSTSQSGLYGYNSATGRCDLCMSGCDTCYIDYSNCRTCESGWEYKNHSCLKAEVGLAATILALSFFLAVAGILAFIVARNKSAKMKSPQ